MNSLFNAVTSIGRMTATFIARFWRAAPPLPRFWRAAPPLPKVTMPVPPPALSAAPLPPHGHAVLTDKGLPKISRHQTLAGLLANIEYAFDVMSMPCEISWIDTDTRVSLRRLGAHIAPESQAIVWDEAATPKIDPKTKLSALVFVAFPPPDAKNLAQDTAFVFAYKLRKSPHNVERWHAAKAIYAVGLVLGGGKTMWAQWYVGVGASGELRALKQRFHRQIQLPNRESYCQPAYEVPKWFAEKVGYAKSDHTAASCLAFALGFWQILGSHWKVAVKKGKDRVTWCVPMLETKHYFADRSVTARTPTGQRAKIIHYVNAHERDIGGRRVAVKAHIRGQSRFEWRGYDCTVIPPEFRFTAAEFEAPCTEYEHDLRNPIPSGMMAMSAAAKKLVVLEERRH